MNDFRIGIGYDVHKLVTGRDLVIGGVLIPYSKGLLGHSDADVLTHAVMDSILGALGKGDIGLHFPDSCEKYKGVSSIMLLSKVNKILSVNNYEIINIDTIIIAQKPKMSPYFNCMVNTLSNALQISADKVNLKATTEEGLGFTGDGSGIAAKSICLIKKIS